jgi:hypothetical protein
VTLYACHRRKIKLKKKLAGDEHCLVYFFFGVPASIYICEPSWVHQSFYEEAYPHWVLVNDHVKGLGMMIASVHLYQFVISFKVQFLIGLQYFE